MIHEIKKDAYYSIYEILEYKIVSSSLRMLQIYAKKNNIKRIDNSYRFSGHQVLELKEMHEKRAKKRAKKLLLRNELRSADETFASSKKEVEILSNAFKNELQTLREENAKLKEALTEQIPHKEKLKNAIQLITLEAMEQNVQHKVFTDEEYNDLIGTISEVDFQKEQVQYLRSRVEKQDEILQQLQETMRQRNFIEAKEKGFDKK